MCSITAENTVDHLIEKKLGSQIVQSCSKNGFVLSESKSIRNENRSNRALYKPIQILTRSPGEVPAEHLNGSFVYRVCYTHFVCNPPIHVVIPVVVCEKNKLGIRCHYYPYTYNKDTNEVSAADVARAGAKFLAVFLPKALHCNLHVVENNYANSNALGNENDDNGDDDGTPEENVHEQSPRTLYESEEARIDQNERDAVDHMSHSDEHMQDNNVRTKVILHVRILQKRFDINDKQISAVGVLATDAYKET